MRYAALAPAEAKKNTMHHMRVRVFADSDPLWNSTPVRIRTRPDRMYVELIMTFRPTVSNRRPSSSGPRKLPMASGIRYQGALAVSTFTMSVSTRAKVKNTAL